MVNDPAKLAEARRQCIELLGAWREGEMNLDVVLERIVEVWTGQADRIVRVGEAPKQPEIQG